MQGGFAGLCGPPWPAPSYTALLSGPVWRHFVRNRVAPARPASPRQSYGENAAGFRTAAQLNRAMVRFGDPLNNGEPQSESAAGARPGLVSPIKALENVGSGVG